ncbi:MAG: class I tRNA ligase family protein, partial [Candidatus Sungbacteria bacterium]|nr:class I tRNA ligase family protein [Candidatus Sungbacteria bacterium]
DLKHPYITYQLEYMESVWWIIKEIWKKGFLYQDYKVVPWCSRCGTGLSTHELGQPGAYQMIKENSVFVKLKILTAGHANEYLLIWTTTPWTLPANVSVAVNQKIEYTKFKIGNEYVWSATTPPYGYAGDIEVVEKVSGRSLLGLAYEPLYSAPKEYSFGTSP